MLKVRLKQKIKPHIMSENSCYINELTRLELVRLAKKTDRYERKVTSGVKYQHINVPELLDRASEDLDITFTVGDYTAVIRFEKFIPELRLNYSRLLKKNNNAGLSKNQMKVAISKALVGALDTCDMRIECSCPDFTYRFAYVATIGNYKLGVPERRPAMRTNPNNKGSMCKHLSAIVGVYSRWSKKVINDLYKTIEWDNTLLIK